MSAPTLHGTNQAEIAHREQGTWPCRWCAEVRDEIERQLIRRFASRQPAGARLAEAMTFGDFTTAERWEIAVATVNTGASIPEVAHILGIAIPQAQQLVSIVTARTLIGAA